MNLVNFLSRIFFSLVVFSMEGKKSLILIASSDTELVYKVHKQSWRRYMNAFEDQFECYFVEFCTDLTTPYLLKNNILKIQGQESYIPGIFDKSFKALEFFQDRLSEFDYIIRPNLSSFLILPRLKKFLDHQTKKSFYAGPQSVFKNDEGRTGDDLDYATGSCIIFSTDLAYLLLENGKDLLGLNYSTYHADDLLFARFFKKQHVSLNPIPSFSIESYKEPHRFYHLIPEDIFHFRVRTWGKDRYPLEKLIHQELYELFYE